MPSPLEGFAAKLLKMTFGLKVGPSCNVIIILLAAPVNIAHGIKGEKMGSGDGGRGGGIVLASSFSE